jgi:hypothetical protein
VADVRRGADRVDPVRLRLVGHRDRVIKVTSTVVETREDVAVEIDGDANPAIMPGDQLLEGCPDSRDGRVAVLLPARDRYLVGDRRHQQWARGVARQTIAGAAEPDARGWAVVPRTAHDQIDALAERRQLLEDHADDEFELHAVELAEALPRLGQLRFGVDEERTRHAPAGRRHGRCDNVQRGQAGVQIGSQETSVRDRDLALRRSVVGNSDGLD